MLAISRVDTTSDVDLVRDLLQEYFAWVLALAAGSCEAPTFQGYDQELADLPGLYAPPKGRLLLATWDGQPAGCIALKAHDAAEGELKRLYVRPAFRGLHIGKRLVKALIEEARKSGYRRLKLDSHVSMENAHAIYRAAGFKDVGAPADFPEQFRPIVVFMELEIEPQE